MSKPWQIWWFEKQEKARLERLAKIYGRPLGGVAKAKSKAKAKASPSRTGSDLPSRTGSPYPTGSDLPSRTGSPSPSKGSKKSLHLRAVLKLSIRPKFCDEPFKQAIFRSLDQTNFKAMYDTYVNQKLSTSELWKALTDALKMWSARWDTKYNASLIWKNMRCFDAERPDPDAVSVGLWTRNEVPGLAKGKAFYYKDVNSCILRDNPEEMTLYMPFIRCMVHFIANTPATTDKLVYRGTQIRSSQMVPVERDVEEYGDDGRVFRQPMFIATSPDREFAYSNEWCPPGCALIRYRVPAGCTNCSPIPFELHECEEEEWILPPYTPIKYVSEEIVDMPDGSGPRLEVTCEVLPFKSAPYDCMSCLIRCQQDDIAIKMTFGCMPFDKVSKTSLGSKVVSGIKSTMSKLLSVPKTAIQVMLQKGSVIALVEIRPPAAYDWDARTDLKNRVLQAHADDSIKGASEEAVQQVIAGSAGGSAAAAEWFFQEDSGAFKALGEDDSGVLDSSYSSNPAGRHEVSLGDRKMKYNIDFDRMEQTSPKTGKVRALKRVPFVEGHHKHTPIGFQPLDTEDSRTLESRFSAGPLERHEVQLGPRKYKYIVDFARMEQYNRKSRKVRALKRCPVSDWFFQDNAGMWRPLDSRDSWALESAYNLDPAGSHQLRMGPYRVKYIVDFTNMTQSNPQTEKVRPLKRHAVVDWLFADDAGNFLPLDVVDSSILESCYAEADRTGTHELPLGPKKLKYMVDFARMEQCNPKTRKTRELKRAPVVNWLFQMDEDVSGDFDMSDWHRIDRIEVARCVAGREDDADTIALPETVVKDYGGAEEAADKRRRRKLEEEEVARRTAEEEAARQREEEEEEVARKKAEEEAERVWREEEATRAEEVARKRAEEEEEAARKREEEEAARKREEEEEAAWKREEEEAARKREEEEETARKREEAVRNRETEEEAARKREEEEAAQKREKEDEQAARIKAEEEAAQRRAEEEATRKREEDEARNSTNAASSSSFTNAADDLTNAAGVAGPSRARKREEEARNSTHAASSSS